MFSGDYVWRKSFGGSVVNTASATSRVGSYIRRNLVGLCDDWMAAAFLTSSEQTAQ